MLHRILENFTKFYNAYNNADNQMSVQCILKNTSMFELKMVYLNKISGTIV